MVADGVAEPLCVDLFNLLYDFKEPRSAGNAVGFEGRGDRQTDGFLCPRSVCHDQVGGQWIKMTGGALGACVIGLQING